MDFLVVLLIWDFCNFLNVIISFVDFICFEVYGLFGDVWYCIYVDMVINIGFCFIEIMDQFFYLMKVSFEDFKFFLVIVCVKDLCEVVYDVLVVKMDVVLFLCF